MDTSALDHGVEISNEMMLKTLELVKKPTSEREISELAMGVLRIAGAMERLPTPIEDLIACAGIQDITDTDEMKDRYIFSLPQRARGVFQSAWQKIRGIADLRERTMYVPKTESESRSRRFFARAHEFGHHVIPWHKVNNRYVDNNHSLTDNVIDIFDREANLFGAEIIFQGSLFTKRVRDYAPSFNAAFRLSDEHGASKHATLRRYVEDHDETIALIPYWPSKCLDERGYSLLRATQIVGSKSFTEKNAQLRIPPVLDSRHDWTFARELSEICEGNALLQCNHGSASYQWQSWWNHYCLLVLLRRKPLLSFLGQMRSSNFS